MSNLILMSWKQRLVQVGTCAVSRNIRILEGRSGFGLIAPSTSSLVTVPGSQSQLQTRRGIATSPPSCGEPLARRRQWRERLKPEQELTKLIEEAQGLNVNEELEKVKDGNIITVPIHLEKRLERRMEKERTERGILEQKLIALRSGNTKKIIIHCKRFEFNHYKGQTYDRRNGPTLASEKWRHRKSAGDFFTLFPGFKHHRSFFMEGTELIPFADLGVSEKLIENLKTMGITQPTHIQVFGIPQIMKGKRTIVAAETGCGKTLVYLLPVINQIMEDRRYRVRSKPGQPSTIILTPSRELADQIYEVALQLTYNLDVKVKLVQGGNLGNKIANPGSSEVDILVATTNAIKVLSSTGVYGLSRVHHVILDEADTLLDDSFFPELVGPFLQRFPWTDLHRSVQLTLVSATMPKGLYHTIGQLMNIDHFYECKTPSLHCITPHVPQTFLRIRKSQKAEKIKEIIKTDYENKIPIIIFCNKSETCDWLSHYLNNEGYDCAAVHGRMPPRYRDGRVDAYKRGDINLIICTDLASRGIDTVRTQHVINYEFPIHMADYIHRCGRTGRVGSESKCRVTNFIARPGEIATVNEIELSVRKGNAPDVNANIKQLYGQHYGEFVEIKPINEQDEERERKEREDDEEEDDEDSESEEYDDDNENENRNHR